MSKSKTRGVSTVEDRRGEAAVEVARAYADNPDAPGAPGADESASPEQNVGAPNGAGTDAPGEPSIVPVQQNCGGNGGQRNKPEESKVQRFKRLAMARYPKAVKAILALAPLANKAQYESSEAQRAFMLAKLEEAILKVRSAFTETGARAVLAEPLPD